MTRVSREMIVAGLRDIGLGPGDRYIVHSSLSSMGRVEGGADTVVDALIEAVSPGGTVFVPTMTFGMPFELDTTDGKVGVIPAVLRRRPGALRSRHPSHSVAGIGPDAARILDGHERTTPMGPDSPLARLAVEGGYIVLLGVTQTSNSTIHAAQELLPLPYFEGRTRVVAVHAKDGSVTYETCRIPGCSAGFDKLEPVLLERGMIRFGGIGDAVVRIMKSADVIGAARDVLAEDPAALFCDAPDCEWCSVSRGMMDEA